MTLHESTWVFLTQQICVLKSMCTYTQKVMDSVLKCDSCVHKCLSLFSATCFEAIMVVQWWAWTWLDNLIDTCFKRQQLVLRVAFCLSREDLCVFVIVREFMFFSYALWSRFFCHASSVTLLLSRFFSHASSVTLLWSRFFGHASSVMFLWIICL